VVGLPMQATGQWRCTYALAWYQEEGWTACRRRSGQVTRCCNKRETAAATTDNEQTRARARTHTWWCAEMGYGR
jgi:hypothetical protein